MIPQNLFYVFVGLLAFNPPLSEAVSISRISPRDIDGHTAYSGSHKSPPTSEALQEFHSHLSGQKTDQTNRFHSRMRESVPNPRLQKHIHIRRTWLFRISGSNLSGSREEDPESNASLQPNLQNSRGNIAQNYPSKGDGAPPRGALFFDELSSTLSSSTMTDTASATSTSNDSPKATALSDSTSPSSTPSTEQTTSTYPDTEIPRFDALPPKTSNPPGTPSADATPPKGLGKFENTAIIVIVLVAAVVVLTGALVHCYSYRTLRTLRNLMENRSRSGKGQVMDLEKAIHYDHSTEENILKVSPLILPPPSKPLLGLGLALTDTIPQGPEPQEASSASKSQIVNPFTAVGPSSGNQNLRIVTERCNSLPVVRCQTSVAVGCIFPTSAHETTSETLSGVGRPVLHRRALSDSKVSRSVEECFAAHFG